MKLSLLMILPAFLAVLSLQGCGKAWQRLGPDGHASFTELKAAYVEGRDYSVESYDRGGEITVLAPHGGDLERGASRLARLIAGEDHNLYVFNAWLGRGSGRLHITSARFDDPLALGLASKAVLAVSLHGQSAKGQWVCVGGSNAAAGKEVSAALEKAGFRTEFPCRRLPGASDKNIVNRASAGGVQLEITLDLLKRLDKGGADLPKFTYAVRKALAASLKADKETGR